MVVVMRPGAAPEEIDAVVAASSRAGGEAFVSRGVQRTIIGLVGDVVAFQALNLRAMPGVGEVVRVSKPYKLVSRENHPDVDHGQVGGVPIGPDTFTLIAGPCAVETPEQTLAAARMAQDAGATLLRGGAFKPRTSPYAFQGLGKRGLRDPRRRPRARPACPSSPRSSTPPTCRWSPSTPTCSRSAPATCRTSRCCRPSARPGSR